MANQNARLYVGGYQSNSTTEKLEEIFGKYGPILEIKRNRNFSFVQYGDEGHAQAAISGEHGKSYFGKILDVQIAKQSRPLGDRDNDRDKDRGGMPNVFQGPPFGGFDGKRDEGFRDGSPGGFRGRPSGPPEDRFDQSFGGPGGFGQGPPGFDRGPPGPGYNGQGPRGGPGFGGPPRGGSRYDDGPGGFRDGPPSGDRYSGPPGGGRGYSGPGSFRGGMDGPPEHPPTQPPGPLAISHENRTNDVEIIVINKAITDYGEFIEQKLKALAFTVDLLFPNEEVPLRRVLANIASRGTLYAVLVTPQHREKRSLTLNILHGAPQEHRNMLIDDAVTLISRNYEMYVMQTADKNRELPPEDIRSMLQQFIQGRHLNIPQLDKVLMYFTQQKARAEQDPSNSGQPPLMPSLSGQPPMAPPNKGTSLQETELQNRILNILNKGGGGMPQPPPPMVVNPPNPGPNKPPPLLNDPSVQKAIDNLIQGFNPNNRMKR